MTTETDSTRQTRRRNRCPNTFAAYLARHALHQSLDTNHSYAACYIDRAMEGDEDAAHRLSVALPNRYRGSVAVALWRAKIPVPSFRTFLGAVWRHDHRYLIEAAGTCRTLRAMFRYARFAIPDHLPPTIRAWRATSFLTRKQAERGYSWTLDRDVACWFAVRFSERNGRPLVLATEVPRWQ